MKAIALVLTFCLVWTLPIAAGREKVTTVPPEKMAEAGQIAKRADSMLARKYFEDAALEYQKALAITPLDHVMQNKLGIAYHQLQNLEMAKKQYDRARKINPKYHEAWNNLGTVNYSLKKYKRGSEKLQEGTGHQSRVCDNASQFGRGLLCDEEV
jgi:Flp pilus assembly protein TadD